MPAISSTMRFILWIITGMATTGVTLLFSLLDKNIRYEFKKRVGKLKPFEIEDIPKKQPRIIWNIFFLSILIAIVSSALASSLPSADKTPEKVEIVEPKKDEKPYSVEPVKKKLIVFNEKGEPIWTKIFDTVISQALVADLDNDDNVEIIVGVSIEGSTPGWLFVLDEKGNEINKYNTWKKSIYPRTGASDKFNINSIYIDDLNQDGQKEIIVAAQDFYWFAARLVILHFQNHQFKELGEYWNPGLWKSLYIADVDKDGNKEIICTAENNFLQSIKQLNLIGNVSVVFALDSRNISGQAPPYWGEGNTGSELWYGYVPSPSVPITDVDFTNSDTNLQKEIHITLQDSCSWYLSRTGEILRLGMGSNCTGQSSLILLPK